MTSRDFCYWLQGFLEIGQPEDLTHDQLGTIQKHLSMVFVHELDPQAGPPAAQQVLNQIHSGNPFPDKDVVYRC